MTCWAMWDLKWTSKHLKTFREMPSFWEKSPDIDQESCTTGESNRKVSDRLLWLIRSCFCTEFKFIINWINHHGNNAWNLWTLWSRWLTIINLMSICSGVATRPIFISMRLWIGRIRTFGAPSIPTLQLRKPYILNTWSYGVCFQVKTLLDQFFLTDY